MLINRFVKLCNTKEDLFKEWILKEYKTYWHTLANETLMEAMNEYNLKKGKDYSIVKFWD